METNDRNYWQRKLSRRTLLRGTGVAAVGVGALALAGCGMDSDNAAAPMPTTTPGPPKAELIIYRGRSPHLTVADPQTGEVKRSADIPNFKNWSWNDPENYFDGQNLWMVGFNNNDPDTDSAEVILVNVDTLAVTKRIPLGKEGKTGNRMLNIGRPSPDGRAFVGMMFAGEVSVLDTKTQTIVMQKKVGDDTDQACGVDFGVASDGVGRLYAATAASGRVLLLDPKTLAMQRAYSAPQGVRPIMLTVAPGAERVWVQSLFPLGSTGEHGSLTVLDAKTLAVVKQIDTGKTPYYATFSPDAKLAYIGHNDGAHVSVFDTSTFAEVKRLEVPMAMAVPQVAAHPDGGSIWIGVGTPTETWGVRVETATWNMSDPIGKGPSYAGNGGFFMRRLA